MADDGPGEGFVIRRRNEPAPYQPLPAPAPAIGTPDAGPGEGYVVKPAQPYQPAYTKPVATDPATAKMLLGIDNIGDWFANQGLTVGTAIGRNVINATTQPEATLIDPVMRSESDELTRLWNLRQQAMQPTNLGEQYRDFAHKQIGIPPYEAKDEAGRSTMRTLEGVGTGAVLGAPYGVGGAIKNALASGTSSLIDQFARDRGASDRDATILSMLPSAVAGAGGRSKGEPPSTTELRSISDAGYGKVRMSPVLVDRDPIKAVAANAIADLSQTHQITPDAGGAGSVLRIIESRINAPGPMNFNEIINLREELGRAIDANKATPTSNGNANEVALASRLSADLESHLDTIDPSHIMRGTPEQLAQTMQDFRDARDNWRAASASNRITGELVYPEGHPQAGLPREPGLIPTLDAAAETGRDFSGALERRLTLGTPTYSRLTSGMNKAEVDSLNDVRRGGPARNLAGLGARVLGGDTRFGIIPSLGMGVGAGLIGHSLGLDPSVSIALGGAIPSAEAALKGVQNRLARQEIEGVATGLRRRSPAYAADNNVPPLAVDMARIYGPSVTASQTQPPQAEQPPYADIPNVLGINWLRSPTFDPRKRPPSIMEDLYKLFGSNRQTGLLAPEAPGSSSGPGLLNWLS